MLRIRARLLAGPWVWENRKRNSSSLHFATPDFLWTLVALADLMRLSLRERRTRGFVQCCVAGNPGRDDKGEGDAPILDRLRGSQVSKARPGAPFDSGGRVPTFAPSVCGRERRAKPLKDFFFWPDGLRSWTKALVGLRPAFSSQVRWGEPGAPVQFSVRF